VDIATVDALARLQLTARRLGWRLRLRNVSVELGELIELAGLTGVLGVEPVGQPEEREVALDVEERVQPGDLPA
jgi:anti-anti-sigma regulatory factor